MSNPKPKKKRETLREMLDRADALYQKAAALEFEAADIEQEAKAMLEEDNDKEHDEC